MMNNENENFSFENGNILKNEENENEIEDTVTKLENDSVLEDVNITTTSERSKETPLTQSEDNTSVQVQVETSQNSDQTEPELTLTKETTDPSQSQVLPTPSHTPNPEQCEPLTNSIPPPYQFTNQAQQEILPSSKQFSDPSDFIPYQPQPQPEHQFTDPNQAMWFQQNQYIGPEYLNQGQHFMPPQQQFAGQSQWFPTQPLQNQQFMTQPPYTNQNFPIQADGQPTSMMPISYGNYLPGSGQMLAATGESESTVTCWAKFLCGCFFSDDRPFETPIEPRIKEAQKKLSARLKKEMPWDLLGQPDYQWHDSWLMSRFQFASFRVLLASYTIWAIMTFYDNFYTNTWVSGTERLMDPTCTMRFWIVFLALLSVTIGIVSVSLFSVLRLMMPEERYKKLVEFKVNRAGLGKWRAWAIFGINHHYDMAPVLSTFPLALFLIPVKLFDVSVRQSILPALILPILVAIDWWIAKRCRFDKNYPRRWTIFMIIGMALVGMWLVGWNRNFFRYFLAIFKRESVLFSYSRIILIAIGFIGITAMGNDFMTAMIKVKVEYLLSPAVGVIIRDPEERLAENEAIYKKKLEDKKKEMVENQQKIITALGLKLPVTTDIVIGATESAQVHEETIEGANPDNNHEIDATTAEPVITE